MAHVHDVSMGEIGRMGSTTNWFAFAELKWGGWIVGSPGPKTT